MKKRIGLLLKVFLSLGLTLLFFIFITRGYSNEGTYKNSFSKIIANFGSELKSFSIVKGVTDWFYPELNENQKDDFIRYKLVIVLKYLDNYFKDILTDTQEKILDNNIENFKKTVFSVNYYNRFKNNLKQYLVDNKDILEISLYEEDGEKLIGVKYKKVPGYTITKELIEQLKVKNNLLLKHQNSSNLILLSMVQYESKPFIIVSQTINQNFFARILDELEVSDNLFYFKDSKDFVILDNYRAYSFKEEKKAENSSYNFYKTFVKANDVNLKINLSNVDYSLGVVVNKNNFWGNVAASLTLILFFTLAFVFLDWVLSKFKILEKVLSKQKSSADKSKKINEINRELARPAPFLESKRTVFDDQPSSPYDRSSLSNPSTPSNLRPRNGQAINPNFNPTLSPKNSERSASYERRDRSVYLDVEEKES